MTKQSQSLGGYDIVQAAANIFIFALRRATSRSRILVYFKPSAAAEAHTQRVRLLDFWSSKSTINFSKRDQGIPTTKSTIYISEPKAKTPNVEFLSTLWKLYSVSFCQGIIMLQQWCGYWCIRCASQQRCDYTSGFMKRLRFIFRSQNRGRPTTKGYDLFFGARIPTGWVRLLDTVRLCGFCW